MIVAACQLLVFYLLIVITQPSKVKTKKATAGALPWLDLALSYTHQKSKLGNKINTLSICTLSKMLKYVRIFMFVLSLSGPYFIRSLAVVTGLTTYFRLLSSK